MKSHAKILRSTERVIEMTLTADSAADELLLTHINHLMRPDMCGCIRVHGTRDNPDEVFEWTIEVDDHPQR